MAILLLGNEICSVNILYVMRSRRKNRRAQSKTLLGRKDKSIETTDLITLITAIAAIPDLITLCWD